LLAVQLGSWTHFQPMMIMGPGLHLPEFKARHKGDQPTTSPGSWPFFDLPLCFITPLGAIRQKVKAI